MKGRTALIYAPTRKLAFPSMELSPAPKSSSGTMALPSCNDVDYPIMHSHHGIPGHLLRHTLQKEAILLDLHLSLPSPFFFTVLDAALQID